jgi:hypothetical protein
VTAFPFGDFSEFQLSNPDFPGQSASHLEERTTTQIGGVDFPLVWFLAMPDQLELRRSNLVVGTDKRTTAASHPTPKQLVPTEP